MKELLTSSGVVQVDVLFVEPEAPYIASSGDAPSVLPLKATCIVSSICSLLSCTDRGQFSIMQPDVLTYVTVCSLTMCMVVSRQFRLVQTELIISKKKTCLIPTYSLLTPKIRGIRCSKME